MELLVKFASQIYHKNINKPLDGAYLSDFGLDVRPVYYLFTHTLFESIFLEPQPRLKVQSLSKKESRSALDDEEVPVLNNFDLIADNELESEEIPTPAPEPGIY